MKKYLFTFLILLIASSAFAGFAVQGVDPASIDGISSFSEVDGVSAYTDYSQDPDCFGFWPFYSGSETDDQSSDGTNDLTADGAPTFDDADLPATISGASGAQYAIYNGSTHHYILPANQSANMCGKVQCTNVSWAYWFYPTEETVNYGHMGIYSIGSFAGSWFTMVNLDDVWFLIDDAVDSHTNSSSSTDLNTWYFVCYAFAGADPDGTESMYISTESAFADVYDQTDQTKTGIGFARQAPTNHDNFTIASDDDGTIEFHGRILFPIAFKRAINRNDCQNMWQKGPLGID